MLGAIFGDIVGSIFEFNNIKTKEFPLISDSCDFTDDTVMTLAIAKAILKAKKNDYSEEEVINELVNCMRDLGNRYPYRGYGGMFYRWLCSSNPKPYNSFGNGSAMRVSSIGFLFETLEETQKYAELSAIVTHNHKEGIKGAKAVASAIYLARKGYLKDEIKRYIEDTYEYNLDNTIDYLRDHYYFNETCQETVPEAIICFMESNSYEDAIRNAISIGGDSDTLACITGSIAEAFYGMPNEYKEIALNKLDDELRDIYYDFINEVNNNG